MTVSVPFLTTCLWQVRQLLCQCYGGRKANQSGSLGYGWSGGLRQATSALLPPDCKNKVRLASSLRQCDDILSISKHHLIVSNMKFPPPPLIFFVQQSVVCKIYSFNFSTCPIVHLTAYMTNNVLIAPQYNHSTAYC